MKRKCAIKETPELDIVLNDKTYTMLFSNSLFIQYEEQFGNLATALGDKANICDFFSKLMYCYFDFVGEELTLQDCKVLILKGGDNLIKVMTECLMESIMLSDDENVKKKVAMMNKEMMKLLKK